MSKASKAEAGAIGGASKAQNDTCLPTTADKLATEYKVSPATIKRDGRYAQAVDTLAVAYRAGSPTGAGIGGCSQLPLTPYPL